MSRFLSGLENPPSPVGGPACRRQGLPGDQKLRAARWTPSRIILSAIRKTKPPIPKGRVERGKGQTSLRATLVAMKESPHKIIVHHKANQDKDSLFSANKNPFLPQMNNISIDILIS